jgi:hypothetical protein
MRILPPNMVNLAFVGCEARKRAHAMRFSPVPASCPCIVYHIGLHPKWFITQPCIPNYHTGLHPKWFITQACIPNGLSHSPASQITTQACIPNGLSHSPASQFTTSQITTQACIPNGLSHRPASQMVYHTGLHPKSLHPFMSSKLVVPHPSKTRCLYVKCDTGLHPQLYAHLGLASMLACDHASEGSLWTSLFHTTRHRPSC